MFKLNFPQLERSDNIIVRYRNGLLITLGAIVLRLVFGRYLGETGFAVFLVAILLTAWISRLGPSLLCQTLLLLATMFWFNEPGKGSGKSVVQGLISIAAYYGVGTVVALLSEAHHRSRLRERRQREEVLRQREQLRATLTCMGDCLLATDAEGRVTLVNPAAERLIGWPNAEAACKLLCDVLIVCEEDSQTPVDDPFSLILDGPRDAARPSLVLINRRGQRVPIAFDVSAIRDTYGQGVGHVLVFRDETDRRRAERSLRYADRRKDEFLATLAHELRNPLAPICAGLELMKLPGQDQNAIDEVRSIMERQTKHMVRLIDDLLDVSRITRGRLELRKCPVLLSELVQNAVDTTRPLIEEAGHTLTVHLPDKPLLLSADPNRMTQVLSNLLNNSAKYTQAGGMIQLSAERQNDHKELLITIRDNGIGIPADKLHYVFEMFAQINGNAAQGHTGLGIGLTLVKQLVEMHGGKVAVESAGRNRGTTFQIRLPLIHVAPAAPAPTEFFAGSSQPSVRRRVLVVDDNADACETLARMIKQLGHDVSLAADGIEAIDAVRTFRPEVVLMDLGMPHVNGFEAAQQIRKQHPKGKLFLVAVSGWGQDEDKRRAEEAGFDRHFVKPVDLGALKALLEVQSTQEDSSDDLPQPDTAKLNLA